jgi:signal transduction histidine kinase
MHNAPEGVFGHSDHSPACRLATQLRKRRAELERAYLERLEVLGIPPYRDPASQRRRTELIDLAINDAVDVLLQARQLVREPRIALAARIATTQAADGTSPADAPPRADERRVASVYEQAAGALLDVVMTMSKGLIDAERVWSPAACLMFDESRPEGMEESRAGPDACLDFLVERTEHALSCERRRIARDLHDRVGQSVAVASQHLELYAAYVERDPHRAGQRIRVAQEALRGAIDSIRHLTSNLRLSQSTGGLGSALDSYVDALPAEGVNFCVKVNGDESVAPPHVRDETLLVVQEALRNAVTHARPTAVLAHIDVMPHELRATVEDDGTGLDPDLVRRDDPGGGLDCMRERAALLGGSVTISRNRPCGTRVELRVPLEGHCDGDPD